MLHQVIPNALNSLIPYWSSQLLQLGGFGNEYSMILNMIFGELVKLCQQPVAARDDLWWGVVAAVALLVAAYKWGGAQWLFKWIGGANKRVYQFSGTENAAAQYSATVYGLQMRAITHYLVHTRKINRLLYLNSFDVCVQNMRNERICDQPPIDLTVERSGANAVTYTLSAYHDCVPATIEKWTREWIEYEQTHLELHGTETDNIARYPDTISAINHFAVTHCELRPDQVRWIKKLPATAAAVAPSFLTATDTKNSDITSTSLFSQPPLNAAASAPTPSSTTNKPTIDLVQTLADGVHIKLVDENDKTIEVNVLRTNGIVCYRLISRGICVQNWMDNIVNQYLQTLKSKYKNNVSMTGLEMSASTYRSYSYFDHTNSMRYVAWFAIECKKCQQFYTATGINSSSSIMVDYPNVLADMTDFKIDDDVYISVYSSTTKDTIKTTYVLQSNDTQISEFIKKCEKMYKQRDKKVDNCLYHFVYIGGNKFAKHLLSGEDGATEHYSTFDTLFNEHCDGLKRDLDKLKNIEYYRKHGLKRKRGYLFYGPPGTGKTISVVAMALYDRRHIVEIPFHLLKSHEEFTYIMSLSEIDGVSIDHTRIIMLFDEFDFGMKDVNNAPPKSSSNSTSASTSTALPTIVLDLSDKKKCAPDTHELSIATLLSGLDGVSNYNGLVLVGTTNHINHLNPAIVREGRMTPMRFDYLRRQDCIALIATFFTPLDTDAADASATALLVPDRVLSAAKLSYLCQQAETTCTTSAEFICNVLVPLLVPTCCTKERSSSDGSSTTTDLTEGNISPLTA